MLLNTISLSEIRERVNAVIAEEIEHGVECVVARYNHQLYVRSGEENWYRGGLDAGGTPVGCLAVRNRP